MPSHFTYEISDVQRSLQSHRIVLGPEPGYSRSYFIPFPLGTWPYIRDKGSGCSFLFGLSLGVSCFDNPLTHTHRHTDTHTQKIIFFLSIFHWHACKAMGRLTSMRGSTAQKWKAWSLKPGCPGSHLSSAIYQLWNCGQDSVPQFQLNIGEIREHSS